MQQPMQNLKGISNPTTALYMALEIMAKAFQLNNITPTNNNQRSSSNPCYSQIAQSGDDHYASNYIVKPRKHDAAYLHKQMQTAQKEEVVIQLTFEEFDFIAAVGACKETERDNANYTLENNLQQASTSGTQS
uniref:Gag-Pol polyprotein n=1 Tax=Tanacetum cinerariifolium TaxID=118510 RepID=A0A699R985_TANCI|nr:hypothetical protein [Tanacetum cinerariifolium]